jgi:hypothetical protein
MPRDKLWRSSNGLPITLRLVRLDLCPARNDSRPANAILLLLAMIFLRDNVFLERDLTFEDIKPRLLGDYLWASA